MFKKTLALAAALALTAVLPAIAQAAEPGPALRLTSMLPPHRVLDAVPAEVHNNNGKVLA